MSGQLLDIRKKITGVKNTKKITKAMQLVAASKMRQFQKKAVSSRAFVIDLLAVLKLNLQINEDLKNTFTEKRTKGPKLFVVYTSDKGLCGGLNANILRALIKSEKWVKTKENERLLFTVGRKSLEFARFNNIKVEKSFQGLPDKLTTLDALKVVDAIVQYWTSNSVSEIIFLAPHFKNTFTYYPIFRTFLPCSPSIIEEYLSYAKNREQRSFETKNRYMIYEPSVEHVLDFLFEQIIESIFIQSFFELKASEYSSRMIAMQNATDSADRITHELTLTYNKTRQQVITQELAELIGASEALQ